MKAVKSITQLGELVLHNKAKFLLGLGAIAAGGLLSFLLRGRKRLLEEGMSADIEEISPRRTTMLE